MNPTTFAQRYIYDLFIFSIRWVYFQWIQIQDNRQRRINHKYARDDDQKSRLWSIKTLVQNGFFLLSMWLLKIALQMANNTIKMWSYVCMWYEPEAESFEPHFTSIIRIKSAKSLEKNFILYGFSNGVLISCRKWNELTEMKRTKLIAHIFIETNENERDGNNCSDHYAEPSWVLSCSCEMKSSDFRATEWSPNGDWKNIDMVRMNETLQTETWREDKSSVQCI